MGYVQNQNRDPKALPSAVPAHFISQTSSPSSRAPSPISYHFLERRMLTLQSFGLTSPHFNSLSSPSFLQIILRSQIVGPGNLALLPQTTLSQHQ